MRQGSRRARSATRGAGVQRTARGPLRRRILVVILDHCQRVCPGSTRRSPETGARCSPGGPSSPRTAPRRHRDEHFRGPVGASGADRLELASARRRRSDRPGVGSIAKPFPECSPAASRFAAVSGDAEQALLVELERCRLFLGEAPTIPRGTSERSTTASSEGVTSPGPSPLPRAARPRNGRRRQDLSRPRCWDSSRTRPRGRCHTVQPYQNHAAWGRGRTSAYQPVPIRVAETRSDDSWPVEARPAGRREAGPGGRGLSRWAGLSRWGGGRRARAPWRPHAIAATPSASAVSCTCARASVTAVSASPRAIASAMARCCAIASEPRDG